MNLSEIISKSSYLTGLPGTMRDAASQLSTELYNRYYSSIDNMNLLSSFFGALLGGGALNFDEAQALLDELRSNDINVTSPGNKALAIHLREPWTTPFQKYIQFGGVDVIRMWLNAEQEVILVENLVTENLTLTFTDGDSCTYTINEIVNSVTAGVQSTKLYADLSDLASKAFDSNLDIQSAANALISNASISNPTKSAFITAVAGGPTSILNLISSMMTKFEDSEEHPDEGFSTDIVVSEFSWGIVLGALTSVAQIAGAIMVAMSGVFRIVGIVVSTITNLVSNAVSSWVGAATGTTFAVKYGNGLQAFNLVLNTFTTQHHDLAQILRTGGFDSFSAYSQLYPATIVGKLVNPDDPDSDYIQVQELASVNFSFLNNMSIVSNKIKYSSNYMTEDLKVVDGYKDYAQSGTSYQFSFLYSCFSTETPTGALCGGCYHPINLNVAEFFDAAKDFAKTDILTEQANIYCERLYTGVILWILHRLHPLIYKMRYGDYVVVPHNTERFYIPINAEAEYDGSLLELLWQGLKNLMYDYANALLDTSTGNARTSIDFRGNGIQDHLMNQVRTLFNHLRWRSGLEGIGYTDLVIGSVYPGGAISIAQYSATTLAYALSVENFLDSFDQLYLNTNTFLISGSIVPEIPSKCAVTIPTATVMSLFWGLLVDAGIAIAMTAAVVISLKVAMKVKNKIARKQTDVEAKKYKYENTLTGTKEDPVTHQQVPYTIAEQNQAWKEYKSERFKYNILATFTGSSKVAMGAYDSTDTSSDTSLRDVAGALLGSFKNSNVDASNVTLYDILKIIHG